MARHKNAKVSDSEVAERDLRISEAHFEMDALLESAGIHLHNFSHHVDDTLSKMECDEKMFLEKTGLSLWVFRRIRDHSEHKWRLSTIIKIIAGLEIHLFIAHDMLLAGYQSSIILPVRERVILDYVLHKFNRRPVDEWFLFLDKCNIDLSDKYD